MVSGPCFRLQWRRRRSTICRTLALVVVTALCFLLVARAHTPEQSLHRPDDASDAGQDELDLDSAAHAPRQEDLDIADEHQVHFGIDLRPEQESTEVESDLGDGEDHDLWRETQHTGAGDVTETAFSAMFQEMIDLMPPPMSMRSLLAPFRKSGEAHLNDLASRVRVFKPAFEAWEKLQLIPAKDGISYRNAIQRIRAMQTSSEPIGSLIQSYDAFRFYTNQLAARLFPGAYGHFGDLMSMHASFHKAGRGLVFTMGDHQVNYVLTSIRSFRKLGCALPVEVMYLGDDDLGEEEIALLEALPGVVTRDMSRMIDDTGWRLAGWAAKPWAILMSSFQEVLFIDADVLFFVDPESLFDDPQHQRSGALFFKDRNMGRESKRKWLRKLLPKPISQYVKQHNRMWSGESGHMQDSGVVLIDKWRHFVPLLLTTRLNGIDRDSNEAEGRKGVYEMVYGDKETFWLAWEMAGESGYAFHSGSTGIVGSLHRNNTDHDQGPDEDTDDEEAQHNVPHQSRAPSRPGNFTVCSPQLLHFNEAGRPLWLNGWLSPNKFARTDDIDIKAFEVFIQEPAKSAGDKVEPWELGKSNSCCLTAENFTEIAEKDREVLGMIVASAKEIDWDVY